MEEKLHIFLDYIYKTKSNDFIEIECRFGKYNKMSSTIGKNMFTTIYDNYSKLAKSYKLIKDDYLEEGVLRSVYNMDNEAKKTYAVYNLPISIINKTKPVNKTIIKKTKPMKPYEANNIKLDCSIEQTQAVSIDYIAKSHYSKYKSRCTVIDIWNLDMSIIELVDNISGNSNMFYEVELEFNKDYCDKNKVKLKDIIDFFNKHCADIINIIDCGTNTLEDEIKNSISNQVSTLERQYFHQLENSYYSVTEKADGLRKFIYFDNNGNIYSINPTETITFKEKIATNNVIKNALIDGELLVNEFLAFDLLFIDNKDFRKYNFITRINKLNELVAGLHKLTIKFKVKQFYYENIFTKAKYLWENRAKLFKYNLDGLIFTPVYGAYKSNLPILKWKDKHSIDVRLMYNPQYNFTEFHSHSMAYKNGNNSYNTKSGKLVYKQKIFTKNDKYKSFNLVNKVGLLGIGGKLLGCEHLNNMENIVEVEFDNNKKKWIFLRLRDDKDKPNAQRTILSVLEAIVDNIDVNALSKIIYKPSKFALCVPEYNMGFDFVGAYNYSECYNELTNILKDKKSAIVIGCNKYMLDKIQHLTKILILEPQCLEVYGTKISEGYSGLLEHSNNIGISKKTIIEYSPINKTLIKKHSKSKADIVIVSEYIKDYALDYLHSIAKSVLLIKFNKNYLKESCKVFKVDGYIVNKIYANGNTICEVKENYFVNTLNTCSSKKNNILDYEFD
jgi:hypothetical protein